MLSVVCPVYNEEKHIDACIKSVLCQDYPKDDLEVIFVDGRSTDRTREIIDSYSSEYGFIRLLDNPKRIAPTALNIGIKEAKGDCILRLDAHAKYPNNYFTVLVSKLRELDAENVGGVCITLPAEDTPVCRAIAAAMSSPFGMGNSHFRVGADKEMLVDTVPFGCLKREIFDKIGFFDEELVRNQDDEFNGRITKNGGKIWLLPNVEIEYYARNTIGKTAKMFYQYGLFKPLVNRKLQKPTTLRQFFPPLFVAGLVFGGLLSIFSVPIRWIYLSVLIVYLLLSLLFAVRRTKRLPDFLIMPIVFFVIHVSYGAGYWVGIFKQLGNRKIQVESNH